MAEGSRLRDSASLRDRRQRAMLDLLPATPPQQAQPGSAVRQPLDGPVARDRGGAGLISHISPIEAVGGAYEALTDLIELADDAGVGIASAFGATPEQIEQARASAVGGPLPGFADLLQSLEIGDPESGSFAREIANFAVPFSKAGKIKRLKELAESGRAGMMASGAIRGAIADFVASDPEDGRVVDLAEGTMLDNPVFDLLQTQEGETGLERRLKTAVEGAGIVGPAADALFETLRVGARGARNLAAMRQAADVIEQVEKNVEIQRADFEDLLGDPNAPRVQSEAVDEAADTSVTVDYVRNPGTAPDMGGTFGQDVEPSGRYLTERTGDFVPEGFESGQVTFRNPLRVDFGGGYQDESNWKRVLARQYGKTGEELSQAIADDGYDGIITVERVRGEEVTSEIVDLRDFSPADATSARAAADAVGGEGLSKAMRDSINLDFDAWASKYEGKFRPIVKIDGEVFRGLDHGDALSRAMDQGFEVPEDQLGQVAGWKIGDEVVLSKDLPDDSALSVYDYLRSQIPELPPAPAAADAASGGEPGGVSINFARINSSDDVKETMRELADSFSDSITEAQRGVRTWEQTKLDAGEVDAFEILMRDNGKNGATLNAEETLALREMWVQSSRQMRDLTDRIVALDGNVTPAQQIAFRRQLAVHQTIQERVLAVRTETARALNQWRIPAGDAFEFSSQMDQMLAAINADANNVTKLAKRMQEAARTGDTKAVEDLVYGSRWTKVGDAAGQLYYFSLLSGPHTHMRNLLSNSLMLGVTMGERKLANLMGRSFGDEQVVTGEVSAMANGLIEGAKDAFRLTALGRESLERAKAARAEGRPDQVREILEEAGDEVGTFHKARISGESGFGVNKVEGSPISAFSPEKLGLETGRSQFGDVAFHVARMMDAVTTMPTRALSAADEVAKTVNARMELHAQAHRQVTKDLAEGRITQEAAQDRLHDILAHPDESMQILARETAELNTFTNRPMDSASWKALGSLSRIPVLGTFLMPFVRTPYNLATMSAQRSPLAPLSKSWREDLMAGGARTDLAITRMMTGTAAMVSFADMALKGQLTGNGPPEGKERANLMRQGWQPYSVFVGDRYFSYRGMEPISTLIGIAADTVAIIGHTDFDDMDEEKENLVLATTFAVVNSIQNKTYLQGLSNFFAMANDAIRYGESWAERSAGVVSPTIVSQVNRSAIDTVAREVNGMQEAIMARTPGLSSELPARRDVWGREITYGSGLGGLYDFISPIYSNELDPEPADLAMQDLELWISKPKRKTTVGGQKVNLNLFPWAYDDFVRLAGNELTHTAEGVPVDLSGLGFKDAVNALVTGEHPLSTFYDMGTDGPEGTKAEMILDMQRRFQEAAKGQVLRDHPDLRDVVEMKRTDKQERAFQALEMFGN